MTLFEIKESLLQIRDIALSDECTDEQLDELFEIQELYEMKLEEKSDNIASLIRDVKGGVNVLDTEISRLQKKKADCKRLIDKLTQHLFNTMQSLEIKKFKTNLNNFSIQKNPVALNIVDENLIPEQYFITPPPVVDKAAVKQALKDGMTIDGAELTQSESLRIK